MTSRVFQTYNDTYCAALLECKHHIFTTFLS